MLPNQISYADYTIIYEPDISSDVLLKHVRLHKDHAFWNEAHILGAVSNDVSEHDAISVIAIFPGHLSSLGGAAIHETSS